SGRLICPAWRMAQAGIPIGLATDGPLSGNGMDMEGILNLYPKMQKTREGNREILTAKEAVRAGTLGGAEALGMSKDIGSLEVGKAADFIIIDADDFNIQPVYDWYATIVYALRPNNVESVFVGGNQIVADRKMTGFDQDEAMLKLRKIAGECKALIADIAAKSSGG
ncbi:MAG TPA: amidohydrolase family protein, partial [Rectinemataceae bacterium]|nr:amidohydrolase family protein [Rectinemataceae bacterium]